MSESEEHLELFDLIKKMLVYEPSQRITLGKSKCVPIIVFYFFLHQTIFKQFRNYSDKNNFITLYSILICMNFYFMFHRRRA